MIQILVLADDFTGAMDTGVRFGAARTIVQLGEAGSLSLPENAEVLVVDTETRAKPPHEAYDTVFQLVRCAVNAGIRRIYKKTDSGLRGNIGAELCAVIDALECTRLHFVPAFPELNRTTRCGIQYIGDTDVAHSVFGQDPYEPVQLSRVAELISHNWPSAICRDGATYYADSAHGVLVYDCCSAEEMDTIARMLAEKDDLYALAGCAGFARSLAPLLGLEPRRGSLPALRRDLLAVCGSLNPVTLRQLDEAERCGASRLRLTGEQRISPREANAPLEQWKSSLARGGCAILDGSSDPTPLAPDLAKLGLKMSDGRFCIVQTIGTLIKKLLDDGVERTWLLTGGDTLLATLRALQINELSPIGEFEQGVVCSQIRYAGREHTVITKSGGFGAPDLLCRIQAAIDKNNERGPL